MRSDDVGQIPEGLHEPVLALGHLKPENQAVFRAGDGHFTLIAPHHGQVRLQAIKDFRSPFADIRDHGVGQDGLA